MSRMIFGLALVAALGCGSKPDPTPETKADAPTQKEPPKDDKPTDPKPKPDEVKAETPKVETPKTDPNKIAWELDVAKHMIPDAPVRGRIAGADATPQVMVTAIGVTFTVFKTDNQTVDRSIQLLLAPQTPGQTPGPSILGKSWKVGDKDTGPLIVMEAGGKPVPLPAGGYALTLELGQRKGGKVSGKVYLSLPDEGSSVLAGTFTADYFRLVGEKPGADDAPFVAGEVTVTGAAPDAQLRVGYAAFPADGKVTLAESPAAVGAKVPYEHTKLTPGRYLITAGLSNGTDRNGPGVWKWVEVAGDAQITENLTLDATKSGGIEVTGPMDSKDAVLVAPADDAARPPLDPELFKLLSKQTLRIDMALVAGKAVVKNLGPGKYEVRLGSERKVVEVVAGKTADVNLTPAKK